MTMHKTCSEGGTRSRLIYFSSSEKKFFQQVMAQNNRRTLWEKYENEQIQER